MEPVTPETRPTIDRLRTVHIGVDVGQKHDPSAVVVVHVLERPSGRKRLVPGRRGALGYEPPAEVDILETVYEVRHMERLPLGTDYPAAASRVAEIVCSKMLLPYARRLFVDVTGVGAPVYELIRNAVKATEAERAVAGAAAPRATVTRPITFTHGDRYDRGGGKMGKAYLVSRLQALAQTHRIKLPPHHAEAQQMMRELKDYEIHVDQNANDTYGAFKVGSFDDLVTALGLAVLEDPADYMVRQGARLFPTA